MIRYGKAIIIISITILSLCDEIHKNRPAHYPTRGVDNKGLSVLGVNRQCEPCGCGLREN